MALIDAQSVSQPVTAEPAGGGLRLPLLLLAVIGIGLFAGAGYAMVDMIAKADMGEGFVFPVFCH